MFLTRSESISEIITEAASGPPTTAKAILPSKFRDPWDTHAPPAYSTADHSTKRVDTAEMG